MQSRIFTMALLLLGLPLLGCEKPSRGDQIVATPAEKTPKSETTGKETKKEKDARVDTNRDHKKRETPADAKKAASLKDSLDKYRFHWSDEKESDFPLIIDLPVPPVPEEIKGPFPENAVWRTEEKTPEKKPAKSMLP